MTLVRTVRASRNDVFAAWRQPELIARWAVDAFKSDPRPGGITNDPGTGAETFLARFRGERTSIGDLRLTR